jgi:hypothetical protein
LQPKLKIYAEVQEFKDRFLYDRIKGDAMGAPENIGNEIEWSLSYESDKDIVYAEVTGLCKPTNTLPMLEALIAKAERHGCLKWLVDIRQAARDYRTIDWYRRPEVYGSLNISLAVRAGVVFPEVGPQERFFENVCRNKGFNLSVFCSVDDALAWLTRVHKQPR